MFYFTYKKLCGDGVFYFQMSDPHNSVKYGSLDYIPNVNYLTTTAAIYTLSNLIISDLSELVFDLSFDLFSFLIHLKNGSHHYLCSFP